uniref:Uncharacterized protein n=1 Tax=viral metagenome TaxID=1070528 RepID=A0A6C0DD19_9ZZZZ
MLTHFRLIPFLFGLLFGYVVLIWYKAPPIITYEYPHPSNTQQRIYKDTNGVCYSYTATEINCDENESSLRPYPIQG